MKHTRKILIALLVVLTLLMSMTVVSFATEGEDTAPATKIIYFNPGSNWSEANAWFAAWSWEGANAGAWYTATDADCDGIYELEIPTANDKLKLVRFGPDVAAPDWNATRWNESGDISIPTDGSNLLTFSGWTPDMAWSTFTYVAPTFTVVGDSVLCGDITPEDETSGWDLDNAANDMTKGTDGIFTKVYNNVAAGEYKFKVVRNHSWDAAWPAGDYVLTVAADNTVVTISFNPATRDITVAQHTHTWSDATCKDPQKCECGATNGTTTDEHNYSEGKCTVCGADDPNYVAPGADNKTVETLTAEEIATISGNKLEENFDIDGFFTATLGVKSESIKITGANYAADGLTFTGKQVSLTSGKAQISDGVWKNTICFTVAEGKTAKVIIYAAQKTDKTTKLVVLNNDGTAVSLSDLKINGTAATAFDTLPTVAAANKYEFTLPAGTYHIGGAGGGPYIYGITVELTGGSSSPDPVDPPHTHSFTGTVTTAATCTTAGVKTFTCECGEGTYTEEIPVIDHTFANGKCSVCEAPDPDYVAPAPDYYLVGYINGANYGCEGDYENMGEYKFVNGKLTATFTQDSYVFLKTTGNANWFMTQTYISDTTATFYNTTTGAGEKLLVPGNVEVEFTLTVNDDGTLTLSYVAGAAELPETPPTYTVAGPESLTGFNWDPTQSANDMTYENGIYTKIYTGVAQGSYAFKCVQDHDSSWGTAYPGNDYLLTVEHDNSTVTITFDYATKQVSATVEHIHIWTDATCTDPKTCSACSETEGDALGHNFVEGVCSVCQAADPSICTHANKSEYTVDATCTADGEQGTKCDNCNEKFDVTVLPKLGHDIDKHGACTRCDDDNVYTVAGTGAHLGGDWNVENTANDMILSNGVYTIVYNNVAAGNYEFKCARNHKWNNGELPAENYAFTVETDGSTVTITLTFTGDVGEIKVDVKAPDTTPDPELPGDDEPVEELGFFEMIWKAILEFFKSIGDFFAGLFGGAEE